MKRSDVDLAMAILDLRFQVFGELASAAWYDAFGTPRKAWKARHRASRLESRIRALSATPRHGSP